MAGVCPQVKPVFGQVSMAASKPDITGGSPVTRVFPCKGIHIKTGLL
jgi:hypothetical protein